jgi:hypothetical protein
MVPNNVETLRAAHDHWNCRDFAGVIRDTAEGLVYTDNARGLNLNGRDKFREWTEAWATAFSDARIMNPEYIDAGDIVIARFTAEGTNDGPFRFVQAHRTSDDLAVLRNLPLRPTRADCVGRLLLRSIHALDPTWAHTTPRRRSLEPGPRKNVSPSERRAPAAPFAFKTLAICATSQRRIRDFTDKNDQAR